MFLSMKYIRHINNSVKIRSHRKYTTKKALNLGLFKCLVEATGVEPVSEKLFMTVSTSLVCQ